MGQQMMRQVGYIHALQRVHGNQQDRAHHGLLSCPPHQKGQRDPELRVDPEKLRRCESKSDSQCWVL